MKIFVGTLRSIISEALKKSDAEAAAQALQSAAAKMNFMVRAEVDNSSKLLNVFVRLVSGDENDVEATLVREAEKIGWSLLSRSDRRGIVWWFEPGPETKGALGKSKLPEFLWHVTPKENVDSILSNGFEPRQRSVPGTSRRYAPRVYFGTDPTKLKGFAKSADDWVLLRIDRTKLPKGQRFFVDQEFGFRKDGMPAAVFTLDPVPASAVSIASLRKTNHQLRSMFGRYERSHHRCSWFSRKSSDASSLEKG